MAALEAAMQECAQFTDQLDGMLNALQNTADQVNNAEPISAHPEKIKEQMEDNNAIIDDLAKKETAFEAVKKAADEIIQKAPNKNDPAIKDIKKKLDKLNGLWGQIQKATGTRSNDLEQALALAEKFWNELQNVMDNLKQIQDNLNSQEPPGVEPKVIEAQKAELKNIKKGIDSTKPIVDKCKQTGKELMSKVGDSEKPEVKRHIEDLDNAWDNVTSMFHKREKNLIVAMEKAMEYHDTFQNLKDFLAKAEKKFDNLGPIGSDIDKVKKQIGELKDFKDEVDPWMIKVEALNRLAHDLVENATPEQARAIKEPLGQVNRRWEDLNKGINVRQKELEQALLRLGQFQHALNELMEWIRRTDKTLDTLKPVYGDPQVIEVELAKLKVMVNDIQAHQSSVDTLNDAGRQIIESGKGSTEASQTQGKLNELNSKWNNLLAKAEGRQGELEDALREAQAFNAEIQDMLSWLNDVDSALSTSKPVGGLPETAKDQLDRFMEVYLELEKTSPKVEDLLGRGNEYLKKSKDGAAANLQNNLRTLKSRWDNILTRANDKKIKLEIALKEATEFHEALQAFIDWLTNAEKTLANLKPVSRVLETIMTQIEEHKEFQNEVSSQRETMLSLDKKGTHLKYFSQKQDVILIKNLLVSVQHRWEKVVSKSAERTRALDYGYKEAKEFHEAWEFLCGWLDNAAIDLQDMSNINKNDPAKIKKDIERHKEFQKELSGKQPMYDSICKNGKTLQTKAPKPDEPVIKQMLVELKNKWLNVCNLSVEKQRLLEQALLLSGQFKDALKSLMDWLNKMAASMDDKGPVHGDLDTVMSLDEKHKGFIAELEGRTEQVDTIKQTAEDLLKTADKEDSVKIKAQVTELTSAWDKVWSLTNNRSSRLKDALKEAEELHKSVNMLLEWLSDAEMKLRFSGPLPEDEDEVQRQIDEHEKFMAELKEKEKDKDFTLKLAHDILDKCHPDAVSVIKHWITIIQSRWDEVASWALQRYEKLMDHLKQLKDLLALLDELMQWLIGKENTLVELEAEPLPDDLAVIQTLIEDHQGFMDNLSSRQPEIDAVCKPMRPKSQAPNSRKASRISKAGRDSRDGSPDNEPTPGSRRQSRVSPNDRTTPSRSAPRFPEGRKGSRASVSQPQDNRNPRAKALWEKWRHVWMMAWERDRRLKEKLNYLHELEKVKNFDWDDWRKRFLKHHNNKKSRVTDLFRKLDEDGDGYLTRDDFVEGILRNKFLSSRLEMNAVADKFDHGDGMIDWREFIAALRPDWTDRGPLTDMERIDDEINRQVALCTCRQKFKVFQVGEGKYRFGESQKLRLVRILRSTVMVRVGGGWMALDEFLVKNDPCRAKGRTNVELREQFTLAPGVSQSMTSFKPKTSTQKTESPNSSVSGQASRNPSSAGPITKIKQKSERSLGMDVASHRASMDAAYESQVGGMPETMAGFTRRQSTQPGGGPGSRNGSRPPSRTGSNLSLDRESEDGTRGSGVRRTSSMRSGAGSVGRPPYRQTPVGFGSSTPRKTSTPVKNGRTPSNSSQDRTPMSGRIRTPSSSSIPIPINQRTRTPTSGTAGNIQRSGSGLSDNRSNRTSKTTTSYGADGSRITSTTSSYSASAQSASSASQQQSQKNW
jgi:DNA repair exonuclease SbcCD ATPase subunit